MELRDVSDATPLPYDMGRLRNFKAVFGDNPWLWWLPIAGDQKKDHDIHIWVPKREFALNSHPV